MPLGRVCVGGGEGGGRKLGVLWELGETLALTELLEHSLH